MILVQRYPTRFSDSLPFSTSLSIDVVLSLVLHLVYSSSNQRICISYKFENRENRICSPPHSLQPHKEAHASQIDAVPDTHNSYFFTNASEEILVTSSIESRQQVYRYCNVSPQEGEDRKIVHTLHDGNTLDVRHARPNLLWREVADDRVEFRWFSDCDVLSYDAMTVGIRRQSRNCIHRPRELSETKREKRRTNGGNG